MMCRFSPHIYLLSYVDFSASLVTGVRVFKDSSGETHSNAHAGDLQKARVQSLFFFFQVVSVDLQCLSLPLQTYAQDNVLIP